MDKRLRFLYNLGHELTYTLLLPFVGDVRLEDYNVHHWIFVLRSLISTNEAIDRSP